MQKMAPTAIMPAPPRALGFGVRFNPSAEEAIRVYLRRRLAGEWLPDTAGVIHEAEVYKFEPKDLAAAYPRLPKTHNRFFFTTCKRRKAGNGHRMSRAAGPDGSWVGSGDKKAVKNGAGETIGTHETLKYKYNGKSGRKICKTDWGMDEYRCSGMDRLAVDADGNERVLCRVYVLPASKEGSVTLQESLASAAAEQQQQQQPRRQEPVAHVQLPAITQPQAIKKPPPPPRHTQQAPPPKRMPVPQQVVEPPRPKRMRPTLAPLEVPRPRHDMVTPNGSLAMAPPRPSPRATPRRSPGSRPPVAPPTPRPAAEAPTNVMEEVMGWLMDEPEEGNGIIQEEAGNERAPEAMIQQENVMDGHDELWSLLMAPDEDNGVIQQEAGDDAHESTPEKDHAMIQEEAGNDHDDEDGFMSFTETLEAELEEV